MGAVFAATARAPITGLIIIFELTGDYRIVLPLMRAIVVATALSNAITKDTIYTLAEAMGRGPRPLKPDQPLHEIVARFAAERTDSLPVINDDGSLIGNHRGRRRGAISQRSDDITHVAKLARDMPGLRASNSLEDAARTLGVTDHEGVPVTHDDDRDHRLVDPPPRAPRLPGATRQPTSGGDPLPRAGQQT